MGIGTAEGEQRARRAAEEAMVCPLLEQSTIEGAMGVIVNIRGGHDIGMREVLDAVTTVREIADSKANIIFGAVVEEEERADLQVTVIASRFPKAALEVSSGAGANLVDFERKRAETRKEVGEPPAEPQRVAMGASKAEGKPQEAAAALSELVDRAREVRVPEIQDLFPPEEFQPEQPPGAEPDEVGEDLDIPAFMRKRMRMRKEKQQ